MPAATTRTFHDSNALSHLNHRGDFQTCPSCDAEYTTKKWEEHTVEIVLGMVANYKTDSFFVVSECPKCSEKSWVHQSFLSVYRDSLEFSPEEIHKIMTEMKRRVKQQVKRWESSACFTCKKLKSVNNNYLHVWVSCPGRSGPPEKSCDSHVAEKSHSKKKLDWTLYDSGR
jgi:RecG-like helicase